MRTGKPKRHRSRRCPRSDPNRTAARLRSVGRCAFEHQAHGVVELADAGKSGGERDVAERQVVSSRSAPARPALVARAPAPADRRRPRPAGAAPVAGWCSRAGAARPPTPSRSTVPSAMSRIARATTSPRTFHSGDPGRRVGTAALARPEPRPLSGGRCRIEADVAGEGRPHRAAGPAIDPGGQHRGDEPAVEPGVLGLDRPVAVVEIFVHASTVTPTHRQDWRKSDIAVCWLALGAHRWMNHSDHPN